MKRHLPVRPSLAHLRHQAKALVREVHSGHEEAIARCREHHPHLPKRSETAIALSDAQLVIAREYGFASWPKLKLFVEGLEAVERQVADLRQEFARGDADTRRQLLKPAHARERFENYDPDSGALSEADARLLIANRQGYAFWQKYDSYLHLDPSVQSVISAVRSGNREALQEMLRADPGASGPRWVAGFTAPQPIPNDSIPLFCVSEGAHRGTSTRRNEYDLVRDLANAGAVSSDRIF